MAKPVVDCIIEAVTAHVYKVWTGATIDQLMAVKGVHSVVVLGSDLFVVTLSRRYDADEVLAEIKQLGVEQD
jgi:hypothetical protein